VLSTPPAFVLSQDQTLRENLVLAPEGARQASLEELESSNTEASHRFGVSCGPCGRPEGLPCFSNERTTRRGNSLNLTHPEGCARRTGVHRSPCRRSDADRSASSSCSVFKDRVPRRHTAEPSGGSEAHCPRAGKVVRQSTYTTTSRQGLRSVYEGAESFNGSRPLVIAANRLATSGLQKR
jgi:hypothetical protein